VPVGTFGAFCNVSLFGKVHQRRVMTLKKFKKAGSASKPILLYFYMLKHAI